MEAWYNLRQRSTGQSDLIDKANTDAIPANIVLWLQNIHRTKSLSIAILKREGVHRMMEILGTIEATALESLRIDASNDFYMYG